jgi:hypothetical protein
MARSRIGLSDNWLRHVQDVHEKHERGMADLQDVARRLKDGRLRDLGLSVDAPDQARARYEAALVKLESHVAMRAQA